MEQTFRVFMDPDGSVEVYCDDKHFLDVPNCNPQFRTRSDKPVVLKGRTDLFDYLRIITVV